MYVLWQVPGQACLLPVDRSHLAIGIEEWRVGTGDETETGTEKIDETEGHQEKDRDHRDVQDRRHQERVVHRDDARLGSSHDTWFRFQSYR